MEEKKNKSTGKIVTIIILIIVLLGLGGYLTYDKLVIDKNTKNTLEQTKDNLEIEQRKNKENTTKINKLEKDSKEQSNVEEKNYSVVNYNGTAKDIHVYSMGYEDMIYAYKGEMYAAFELETEDQSYVIRNIFTSENPTKTNKEDNIKVQKLNIKESEVDKVLTFDNLRTTDSQYKVYVIYKNGKVRGYYSGLSDLDQYSEVFKNYKVNDLRVSCKKRGIAGCATVNYKLTLQDGTEKTVTKE